MRLPAEDVDDLLPEDDDGPLVLDETSPVAATWDLESLLGLLPSSVVEGLDVELRDALLVAWGAMANGLWAAASRAIGAQQSPRYAEGDGLDEYHGKRRRMSRAALEEDPDYRRRLLTFFERITPLAIQAAVDAIVAEIAAPARAVYQEPAFDGGFWSADDGEPWVCFWQDDERRLWGERGGEFDGVRFGGYWTPVVDAPLFWVFLPVDVDDLTTQPFWFDHDFSNASDACFWQADDGEGAFYGTGEESLVELVIRAVDLRRGFGVPWEMFIDPLIRTAV